MPTAEDVLKHRDTCTKCSMNYACPECAELMKKHFEAIQAQPVLIKMPDKMRRGVKRGV